MTTDIDIRFATALDKGKRGYQEDAIISDISRFGDIGLVVLADGMGGHAAGDVASKIVVTEVFSELLFHRADADAFEANIRQTLLEAMHAANGCLRAHVANCPETRGMGATLVACAVIHDRLYWLSVGDSPLYLFRDGKLTQLNEDHSLAPQIDYMVASGILTREQGACHPDRNTLTSVLFGEESAKVDCPETPLELREGDIFIVASDGLQFLSNAMIAEVLTENGHRGTAEIVDCLMAEIAALDDPDQDNVSISLVKLEKAAARSAVAGHEVSAGMRRVG